MNLNWDSLLEPIFLFILSLIAGTLWVIIPTDPNRQARTVAAIEAMPVAVPAAPIERPKAPKSPLVAEVFGIKQGTAELEQSIDTLQDQLQAGDQELKQLQAANQQSVAQLETERKSLEALKAQVQALEAQPSSGQNKIKSAVQVNKEVMAETQALRNLLAEQQVEAGRLQSQLETTKARPNSEIPRAPTATPANKLPFLLELIHNRAVPFNRNTYRTKLSLTGPTVAQRRSEGETLAEIRQPDSEFNKMVKKLNPDKQFVSCLVNADSFEIFREVRRILQAKHIDIGWEPSDTSSGKLTVYPVHIIKKPEKPAKGNLPRVPPILR